MSKETIALWAATTAFCIVLSFIIMHVQNIRKNGREQDEEKIYLVCTCASVFIAGLYYITWGWQPAALIMACALEFLFLFEVARKHPQPAVIHIMPTKRH